MNKSAISKDHIAKRVFRSFPVSDSSDVTARRITCGGCGAPIDITNAGKSLQATCPYCGSVIDLNSPDLALIVKAVGNSKAPPSSLKLGLIGTFNGIRWKVVGRTYFEQREGSMVYRWNEYILFNPRNGYSWLEEERGHWIYGKALRKKPDVNPRNLREGGKFTAMDRQFTVAEKVTAKVTYVEGEFPYYIQRGDTIEYIAAFSPPFAISAEWNDDHVEWSLAEYVEPDDIVRAFSPKLIHDDLIARKGSHPARLHKQHSTPPGFMLFCLTPGVFAVLAVLAAYLLSAIYPGRTVADFSVPLVKCIAPYKVEASDAVLGGAEQWRSAPIAKVNSSQVDLLLKAPLNESWLSLRVAVVDEKSRTLAEAAPFLAYYRNSKTLNSRNVLCRLTLKDTSAENCFVTVNGVGGSGANGKGAPPDDILSVKVINGRFRARGLVCTASVLFICSALFIIFSAVIEAFLHVKTG